MDDSNTLADVAGVIAQSVAENADRLGLIWQLRLATVETITSDDIVQAVYDSDSNAIAMTSMIGQLAPEDRVWAITVPPAGNYICGLASVSAGLGSYQDAQWSDAGTLITTAAGAETAVASVTWDSEPNFVFRVGRLYCIKVQVGLFASTAASTVSRLRVREGSATTSGQQIAFWQPTMTAASVGASTANSFFGLAYVRNSETANLTTKLSLTVERVAGAANVSLYGDSDMRASITVVDVGTTNGKPGFVGLAVQV